MRRLLIVLAACGSPPEHKLPSASLSPHLRARPPAQACGTDVQFNGVTLRYRYTFDDFGRLSGATGRYDGASEIAETIAYDFDNLDHMVHMLHVGHLDGGRAEIVAQYDTLGDLLEYTWTVPDESRRFVYAQFTEAGLPTREEIEVNGGRFAFRLAYDANGRIVASTPEGEGPTTIYTYDDAARTITIDSGAAHGLITYDAENRQLSEVWTGAQSSEDVYAWDGDRLLTITRRVGQPLQTIATETYRYACER